MQLEIVDQFWFGMAAGAVTILLPWMIFKFGKYFGDWYDEPPECDRCDCGLQKDAWTEKYPTCFCPNCGKRFELLALPLTADLKPSPPKESPMPKMPPMAYSLEE
jgi:hypothetical protein